MPSGFSRCSPLVKTLFLICVSNEILTTQKCCLFFLCKQPGKTRHYVPNSQNCHLYACKVMFTKKILGVPVMPPGKFGPALERSNWTLLNDQSLNVAAILLFFLNFLPCLNCFSTSQSIHLLFLQALRDLFDSMDKTSSSIPPIILLQFLHMAFPQFAEKGDQGQYLQQVKTDY